MQFSSIANWIHSHLYFVDRSEGRRSFSREACGKNSSTGDLHQQGDRMKRMKSAETLERSLNTSWTPRMVLYRRKSLRKFNRKVFNSEYMKILSISWISSAEKCLCWWSLSILVEFVSTDFNCSKWFIASSYVFTLMDWPSAFLDSPCFARFLFLFGGEPLTFFRLRGFYSSVGSVRRGSSRFLFYHRLIKVFLFAFPQQCSSMTRIQSISPRFLHKQSGTYHFSFT